MGAGGAFRAAPRGGRAPGRAAGARTGGRAMAGAGWRATGRASCAQAGGRAGGRSREVARARCPRPVGERAGGRAGAFLASGGRAPKWARFVRPVAGASGRAPGRASHACRRGTLSPFRARPCSRLLVAHLVSAPRRACSGLIAFTCHERRIRCECPCRVLDAATFEQRGLALAYCLGKVQWQASSCFASIAATAPHRQPSRGLAGRGGAPAVHVASRPSHRRPFPCRAAVRGIDLPHCVVGCAAGGHGG